MRRVLILLVLTMFVAVSASAQSVSSTLQSIASFASASNSVVDSHGNLLVFDTVYNFSTGTSGGGTGVTVIPIRPGGAPTTRITVIPGGTGQPLVKEYAATLQVVGAGKFAVYAVFSAKSVRKLIAIDAGAGGNMLPTDLSGFLSADLTLTSDIKLYPATLGLTDTLTSVDGTIGPLPLTPLTSTATTMPVRTVSRIARTMKFDGIRFSTVDVVLPQ